MRFIAFCDVQKYLRYTTIKSYVCGIRFFDLTKGGFNPLENLYGQPLVSLQATLTGPKKKYTNYPKRIRLPFTCDILYKICLLLRRGFFDSYTSILIEAACVMAFFGFLR